MPIFKNNDVELEKRTTNPGLIITAGDITQSDFDDTSWEKLLKDYTDMRDGDCIAAATVKALKLPLMQAPFEVRPGNENEKAKEAAEYIEWQLNALFRGFQYFKRHLLLSLDFGLAMFEKIYQRGVKYNGKTTNIIKYLSPIQLDTVYKFLYDDAMVLTGIEHEHRIPEGGNYFVEIDRDKLFWYTFDEEFENIKGRSLLRPARQMWTYKHALFTSAVRASQKGAGIVRGRVSGQVDQKQKAQMEQLLRTTATAKNAYVMDYKDKFEVELLELKGQQNVMPLLDQANREMFFNTLSEFLMSGIGQGANGSRSATSEHKTAYELLANSILIDMECAIQKLVDEMISISYLGNLNETDWPVFAFKAVNQIDSAKVAQNAGLLYQNGIVNKIPEDENFFREIFGYPEKPEIKQEITIDEDNSSQMTKLETERNHDNYLDKSRANKQFLKGQEEADKIVNKIYMDIIKDFEGQLQADFESRDNLRIRSKYKEDLLEKLDNLYLDLFEDGRKAARTELFKLGLNQQKLAITPKEKKAVEKGILRFVNKFMLTIKTGVENALSKTNIKKIADMGGIKEFLGRFDDGFKGAKRDLRVEVQAGYTNGRSDVLKEFQSEIDLFMYDATLDKNLCENCAPFDGEIYTQTEWESRGFNEQTPVNPDCLGLLGHNDCRCQKVPYKLK
jgi:hypothetical protein